MLTLRSSPSQSHQAQPLLASIRNLLGPNSIPALAQAAAAKNELRKTRAREQTEKREILAKDGKEGVRQWYRERALKVVKKGEIKNWNDGIGRGMNADDFDGNVKGGPDKEAEKLNLAALPTFIEIDGQKYVLAASIGDQVAARSSKKDAIVGNDTVAKNDAVAKKDPVAEKDAITKKARKYEHDPKTDPAHDCFEEGCDSDSDYNGHISSDGDDGFLGADARRRAAGLYDRRGYGMRKNERESEDEDDEKDEKKDSVESELKD